MRIHSLLSPKCRVERSPLDGCGVFASEVITPGEIVAVWGGKVYTVEECRQLERVMPHFGTHTITLCEGYCLGSENLFEFDDSELFNHSCAPNTGVKGQILLVARRGIAEGEELTFDYETTEDQPGAFDCRCGAAGCRGRIDGSAWRRPEFRRQHAGYLSYHIEDLIRREGRIERVVRADRQPATRR